MALSLCSSRPEAAGDHTFAFASFFDPHSEVFDALIGFLDPADDSPLLPLDFFSDSPAPDLAAGHFPALIPSHSDPAVLALPPAPVDVFQSHGPKRHCSCSDLCFDPFVLPQPPPPPAADCVGACLSATSVAARERRKRISSKTQELSRLIPGGSKMNTAEMLEAAHRYIRFLQAQVGVLRLITSVFPDIEEENLKGLLASPAAQERLSSVGKCVVPMKLVEELTVDLELRSDPFIVRDLNRFVESMKNISNGNH